MKRFIVGFLLGSMLASGVVYAKEYLSDFDKNSVVVLNEELRLIWAELREHETRLDDGGL